MTLISVVLWMQTMPPRRKNWEPNSVTERVYRGFPRTMEELQTTLNIFREKKRPIKNLVMNFELLAPRYRDEIIDYLNEFYKSIESKSFVEECLH